MRTILHHAFGWHPIDDQDGHHRRRWTTRGAGDHGGVARAPDQERGGPARPGHDLLRHRGRRHPARRHRRVDPGPARRWCPLAEPTRTPVRGDGEAPCATGFRGPPRSGRGKCRARLGVGVRRVACRGPGRPVVLAGAWAGGAQRDGDGRGAGGRARCRRLGTTSRRRCPGRADRRAGRRCGRRRGGGPADAARCLAGWSGDDTAGLRLRPAVRGREHRGKPGTAGHRRRHGGGGRAPGRVVLGRRPTAGSGARPRDVRERGVAACAGARRPVGHHDVCRARWPGTGRTGSGRGVGGPAGAIRVGTELRGRRTRRAVLPGGRRVRRGRPVPRRPATGAGRRDSGQRCVADRGGRRPCRRRDRCCRRAVRSRCRSRHRLRDRGCRGHGGACRAGTAR